MSHDDELKAAAKMHARTPALRRILRENWEVYRERRAEALPANAGDTFDEVAVFRDWVINRLAELTVAYTESQAVLIERINEVLGETRTLSERTACYEQRLERLAATVETVAGQN